MIAVDDAASLSVAERWALDTLLDLSCVLRCDARIEPAVRVRVADGGAIDAREGDVIVGRDLLRDVVEVAGAATEQRSNARDKHDRVPSSENPLVGRSREREPIVTMHARRLAECAQVAADGRPMRFLAPWPNGHRWAAAFTHDLDVVSAWPVFTGLRAVELLRKVELARLARVAASALGDAVRSPVWRSASFVAETEARHDVRSTWFIICGDRSLASFRRGDVTYDPASSLSRRIIDVARTAGDEIGLHGSFATMDEPATFERQRARLGDIARVEVVGVRQHFIRMRPGATQRDMREAGFLYDASYGFPDRNGFRLGVADIVSGWDERARSASGIDEVPLHWMDRALSKYRGVEDPSAWAEDALELARACRENEGLWVGLWHPNLWPSLGFPDAPGTYANVVRGVTAERPFVAPLAELVRWRRARRAARAVAVTDDGRVALSTPVDAPHPIVIEDAQGARVEWIAA